MENVIAHSLEKLYTKFEQADQLSNIYTSEVEGTWGFLHDGYREMRDKERNTLYKIKKCVDDFEYRITDSNRKRKLSHSILILPKKQIYEMDREIDYECRIYRKRPKNRRI